MRTKLQLLLVTLVMTLFGAGGVNAQTVYTVTLDNGATQTPEGSKYFTINSGGGYNKNYTGTYEGKTYAKGLKLNSQSDIQFTNSQVATLVLVQSLSKNATNTISIDGVAQDATKNRVDNTTDKVGVWTISDLAVGPHKITGTKEMGALFVSVTEAATVGTPLEIPTISFNDETGLVTITADGNASKVTYTTDGTTPTSASTEYTAPFTAQDGDIIKAIAIGDGVNYANSKVAEDTVYLKNAVIAAPTFTTFNGTVLLATESDNATIEYSLDGENYVAYTKPFTLTESKTVYARASRGTKTSEVSQQEVDAIAKPEGTTTRIISYSDISGVNSATTKDGYTLAITGKTDKKWSSGNNTFTIDGADYKSIKVSNGAQNTLTLPAGKVAKRITFYSTVNAANGVCGWKEVAGISYENGEGDYKTIPMGSFKSNDPDVRVYSLDDAKSITFTNAGTQLMFVIAVDVADAAATPESATITSAGYATYVTKGDVDFSANADVKAYSAKYDAAAQTITLTPVTAAPAKTPLVLAGAAGTYELAAATTTPAAVENNDLQASESDVTADGSQWILAQLDGGVGFAKATEGSTIAAGKAYLVITAAAQSKSFIGFTDGTATGINAIQTADAAAVNAPLYNLAGQRVNKSFKGVVIQNGKKFFNK